MCYVKSQIWPFSVNCHVYLDSVCQLSLESYENILNNYLHNRPNTNPN